MISVQELADIIGARIIGDTTIHLSAPNRIEFAEKGEVTFLNHSKYRAMAADCRASAIITKAALVDESLPVTWLVVPDPYAAFALAVSVFFPVQQPSFIKEGYTIHPAATVHHTVQLGAGVYVGSNSEISESVVLYPQVYIGEQVRIGEGTIIYPGAKILDGSVIGNHCIIHAGAVVGADGFGFAPLPDGSYRKIPQMGNVIIEDRVEIGANTCVDRATLGSTVIREGVKLDNLVQVGHNVQIGKNTVAAAQVGFAGSSIIGEQVQIGGQAGFAPHIKIAPYTRINAQSGVSKSVEREKSVMTGSPAVPYMEFNRAQAWIRKLESEIKRLETEINSIKSDLGGE